MQIIIFLSFANFSHQSQLGVLQNILSDSNLLRSLLHAWIFKLIFLMKYGLNSSLICSSTGPLSKPFGILLSMPTIISITVTLMFHSLFSSYTKSKNLSIFSLSFSLCDSLEQQNPPDEKLFFCYIYIYINIQNYIYIYIYIYEIFKILKFLLPGNVENLIGR